MQDLTDRQAQVLRFIEKNIAELGCPPTVREVMAHLGVKSTAGAVHHMGALIRKGYIERDPRKARAIRVLKPTSGAA